MSELLKTYPAPMINGSVNHSTHARCLAKNSTSIKDRAQALRDEDTGLSPSPANQLSFSKTTHMSCYCTRGLSGPKRIFQRTRARRRKAVTVHPLRRFTRARGAKPVTCVFTLRPRS